MVNLPANVRMSVGCPSRFRAQAIPVRAWNPKCHASAGPSGRRNVRTGRFADLSFGGEYIGVQRMLETVCGVSGVDEVFRVAAVVSGVGFGLVGAVAV